MALTTMADMFPNNANETLDDGDGGNVADVFDLVQTEAMDRDDLDGVEDNADAFPDDSSEADSDGDMIRDNMTNARQSN